MLMFELISALCEDAIDESEMCMSTFNLNASCESSTLADARRSFILSFHLYISLTSYSKRFTFFM